MSLLLSTTGPVIFIIHLSHVLDSDSLKIYVRCLLEQITAARSGFDEEYIRKIFSEVTVLEKKVLEKSVAISPEPKGGKLLSRESKKRYNRPRLC